jgi:predicted DNA binding protein
MVFEFEPGKILMALGGDLFKKIRSYEMLELLRMDFEKGVKVVLLEVTLFPGVTLEDIKWPKNVKVTVLTQVGDKYIMIFTFKAPNRMFKKLINKAQADVVWTTPTKYKDGKGTLACIGNEDELKKILKGMNLFGTVKNISYHRAIYQEHNILSVLTDKQKKILLAAKKLGYYDYPRKIDTAGLAAKVGISKATVVEHLRKAEIRIMGNILAGY